MEKGAGRASADGTPYGFEKGPRSASTDGTPYGFEVRDTAETGTYDDTADDLQSYMHNTPNAAQVEGNRVAAAAAKLRMRKKAAIIVTFVLAVIAIASVAGVAGLASSLDANKNETARVR